MNRKGVAILAVVFIAMFFTLAAGLIGHLYKPKTDQAKASSDYASTAR